VSFFRSVWLEWLALAANDGKVALEGEKVRDPPRNFVANFALALIGL